MQKQIAIRLCDHFMPYDFGGECIFLLFLNKMNQLFFVGNYLIENLRRG